MCAAGGYTTCRARFMSVTISVIPVVVVAAVETVDIVVVDVVVVSAVPSIMLLLFQKLQKVIITFHTAKIICAQSFRWI